MCEVYEVRSDLDCDICLADLVSHSRKICTERGIEYDPYNIGVTVERGGNILIYLVSERHQPRREVNTP